MSENPAINNDLHGIFKNPKRLHREVDQKSENESHSATHLINLFKCLFSCRSYFKCLLVIEKPWYWCFIYRIFYKGLTRFFAKKDTWINDLNSENVCFIPNRNTKWFFEFCLDYKPLNAEFYQLHSEHEVFHRC